MLFVWLDNKKCCEQQYLRMVRYGFKPQVVQNLLGIGGQTFRYWRANLDCSPTRPLFSSKDVLVYWVFKLLIQNRHVRVNGLKDYKLSYMFQWIHEKSYDEIKEYLLVLNEQAHTIKFLSADIVKDPYDIHLCFLELSYAVSKHLHAMHNYGEPSRLQ